MKNKRNGFMKWITLAVIAMVGGIGYLFGTGNLASAEQAVLVEEDFDQLEGGLPEGWSVIQGQASIENGKLELSSPSSASPARVLVPLPDKNGNIIFEADMTFVSAVEDTRWASMMFRVQSTDYPYYQFAIRRGTTALNGAEFAERNAQNKWVVPEATFFTEKFEYNKTYRIKIIASNNRVQQFINNKLVINTDQASGLLNGDIGFQANGSTVLFDNVKVSTFEEELPPVENAGAFLPQEPKTNIVNAPTLIGKTLSAAQSSNTASVLLKVEQNSAGELITNGMPLRDALVNVQNKHIPILHIEKNGIEGAIIDSLEASLTTDVHIVSSQPEIVKTITNLMPTARGGIVYTKNSFNKHDLNELVQTVHANNAKVALVPEKLLDAENVHYLHTRMVAVWGIGAVDENSVHALIHTGADGIITDNPATSIEALGNYPENTIVKRPIVAAHRGVPSLAPENTMAGYRLAYELGADQIETDLQLTKDGHLIIMHDLTVNRTTNGTGAVSDLTFEEIRQLDAGIKFSEEFTGEQVPTFKEFLQEFKGKDVILLVELKGAGFEEQVIKEIEEEGMVDQVVLQNFDLGSMIVANELKPEIPVGYLYSAAVPGTTEAKIKNAQKMMDYGTSHNVTLNASYGSTYQEFLTYMRQRGLLTMHWTFRAEEPFRDKLAEGLVGPITDYMQWLTDSPIKLETPIKKINLKQGKTSTVQAKAFVNFRTVKKENIASELFVAEDNGVVRLDGNTIEAVSPGTAQVFVKHTFEMLGTEWNIVGEPVEVIVE
ncbi:glycerophosphodiester phosphodiesterase family protein [Sporosarcina sp. Marseille-Q4943]|uniref:glycerophosphodiester phosphodiesterase family protein n=1 Tax=Sporosarcina sp. Marseille-Q4943 TaxID=2942204 RepID=UPI00208DCA04|nr:glycerophosphodiester phosphodiesterase family protein [Sporosarcina sp. Marseille-Q4943]